MQHFPPMKVPKVFIPEKSLDVKIERMTRSFHKIASLIEQNIGGYWKEREYNPDPLIREYKHMRSAMECANVQYAGYWEREVSMTIFQLDKPAKNCLEEISEELEKGLFKDYRCKYCLIKNDFILVLKTSLDDEGIELFKKHYQEKFGFC